jgi:hypothetical protein
MRGQEELPLRVIESIGSQATQAVIDLYPEAANDTPQTMKASLGLTELFQLINHEPPPHQSIEDLEQHRAAWCIARATGCRPEIIVEGGKQDRQFPLKWSDLEFNLVCMNFPHQPL